MDLDISILVTIVLYEELGKNQSDCKCVEAKRDGMRVQTRKFSKTNPQLIFVSPIDSSSETCINACMVLHGSRERLYNFCN